jgi:hypothetical protein
MRFYPHRKRRFACRRQVQHHLLEVKYEHIIPKTQSDANYIYKLWGGMDWENKAATSWNNWLSISV